MKTDTGSQMTKTAFRTFCKSSGPGALKPSGTILVLKTIIPEKADHPIQHNDLFAHVCARSGP